MGRFRSMVGYYGNNGGGAIGSQELQRYFGQGKKLSVLDVLPRMHKKKDGEIVYIDFDPSSTNMSKFDFSEEGCSPGYEQYFQNIVIRQVVLLE